MVADRVLALSLLLVPTVAAAYQADLVPASRRVESQDIDGAISITGEDGLVRVRIENVNDTHGDALDSDKCTVRLKVRVNGITRRITIPLTVDGGDGEVMQSLGLTADDEVVVADVRVRGPNRRTLAQAGVVTTAASEPTPPEPAPPPSPSECPGVLEECQSDLADCQSDLDDCESAE
jgi:hypothetical protein